MTTPDRPDRIAWRSTGTWLALVVGVLSSAGCDGSSGSKNVFEPKLPVVEIQSVAAETLTNTVELLGQLEAEEIVTVRPEIPGIIASIGFTEGEPVTSGQVLFTLRDGEQRARLHQAQARLHQVEEVHARTLQLKRDDISSIAQLDAARADLEAARAVVEIAEVELERTRIKAPFDGVAGARGVSLGASVDEDKDLVEIQAVDRVQLVFTLPEQIVPLVRVGLPFELTVAPYPGETFPGEISFVSPGLNPLNRRILVKGLVPNPDHKLRPGYFARIETDIGTHENVIALPEDAVVYGASGPFVWRVDDDDMAQRVEVELGLRQTGRVEVVAGLVPGDRVVVAGTNKLTAGGKVKPAEAVADHQSRLESRPTGDAASS